MFWSASSFARNISKWDVSRVISMDQMFFYAESFEYQPCGAAWVNSNATKDRMYEGTYVLLSERMCHASSTQRSLARWATNVPIVKSLTTPYIDLANMMCPNCGMFKKSGRASCCAPGGTWYKNCGGTGENKFDHSWFEGVEACKCKSNVDGCRHTLIFTSV